MPNTVMQWKLWIMVLEGHLFIIAMFLHGSLHSFQTLLGHLWWSLYVHRYEVPSSYLLPLLQWVILGPLKLPRRSHIFLLLHTWYTLLLSLAPSRHQPHQDQPYSKYMYIAINSFTGLVLQYWDPSKWEEGEREILFTAQIKMTFSSMLKGY